MSKITKVILRRTLEQIIIAAFSVENNEAYQMRIKERKLLVRFNSNLYRNCEMYLKFGNKCLKEPTFYDKKHS